MRERERARRSLVLAAARCRERGIARTTRGGLSLSLIVMGVFVDASPLHLAVTESLRFMQSLTDFPFVFGGHHSLCGGGEPPKRKALGELTAYEPPSPLSSPFACPLPPSLFISDGLQKVKRKDFELKGKHTHAHTQKTRESVCVRTIFSSAHMASQPPETALPATATATVSFMNASPQPPSTDDLTEQQRTTTSHNDSDNSAVGSLLKDLMLLEHHVHELRVKVHRRSVRLQSLKEVSTEAIRRGEWFLQVPPPTPDE